MKQIVVLFLLIGILTQCFAKLVIVVNYEVNKNFIAKNLCVNRAKTKSCCKGKCQLNKRLTEEDKKENLPSGSGKDKFEALLFAESKPLFKFFRNPSSQQIFPLYYGSRPQHQPSGIFQPPRV